MIKGGFFGKLLKQLFIISLISCFILLGNSFASATLEYSGYSYYGTLGDSFTEGLYTYNINNSLNFNTELGGYSSNIFFWSDESAGDGYYQSYMWINGKLYTVVGNNDSVFFQGFLNNWCIVSKSVNPGVDSLGRYGCDGKFNYSLDDVLTINPDFFGFTIESIGNTNPSQGGEFLQLCFTDTDNYYCFGCSSLGYCPSGYITGDLNLLNATFGVVSRLSYSFSPFFSSGGGRSRVPSTDSRLSGRLVVNSGYTNSDMIDGFECVGLQPSLCYGGFPITDIFQPNETFEDFTGYIAGEGATIFEIYNLYSGSFSNLNQFLNTVLTRYQNGQINSFKTEPKALLMLGAQMNSAGFRTSYISSYCNLLFNNNNNNIYTGNSVDDLRVQSCLRNNKMKESLKNSQGEDILSQTTNIGIFGSGNDVDFNPDTFFSSLMSEITSKLDKSLTGGSVGIIPGYIIIFTLAFIFIRLISH